VSAAAAGVTQDRSDLVSPAYTKTTGTNRTVGAFLSDPKCSSSVARDPITTRGYASSFVGPVHEAAGIRQHEIFYFRLQSPKVVCADFCCSHVDQVFHAAGHKVRP
jgi:hypothetical protein